jgi:hypothetical protein
MKIEDLKFKSERMKMVGTAHPTKGEKEKRETGRPQNIYTARG